MAPPSGTDTGTPKNLCDKDFAELSGELSGAICLKTLVLMGSVLELFRKFLGAVRSIFWLSGSFLALDLLPCEPQKGRQRESSNTKKREAASLLQGACA